MFEKAISFSNHVGLFSEMVDPTPTSSGQLPQAFTHIASSTPRAPDRALRQAEQGRWWCARPMASLAGTFPPPLRPSPREARGDLD
jgi:hypothetical protein